MRADLAAKLGDGPPGMLAALGGPSRPMTPGASPFRKARRLGGPAPVPPMAAYRTPPVVPPAYEPDPPHVPGVDSGPSDGSDGDSADGGW